MLILKELEVALISIELSAHLKINNITRILIMQNEEQKKEVEFISGTDVAADVAAALASGKIVAFSDTEAGLAMLRQNYEGVVYQVETPEGLQSAKDARKDIASYRISLEKKRTEIKKPYLDYTKLLDSEAKRIASEIESLENPIDAQIKQEQKRLADIEEEKKRIEEARIESHQTNLQSLKDIPGKLIGASLGELKSKLEKVKNMIISSFEEFAESASLYQESVISKIEIMIEQAEEKIKADEAAEALRLENEAKQKEQSRINLIQQSIQLISNKALNLHRYPIEHATGQLKDLQDQQITEEEFFEFVNDAEEAKSNAIEALVHYIGITRKALKDAEELAEMRAQKEREQASIEQSKAAQEVAEVESSDDEKIENITSSDQNIKDISQSEIDSNVNDESKEIFGEHITRQKIIDLVADYFDISLTNAEIVLVREFATSAF